ncbi:dihydroneopterin aldolase [Hahella sp. KA22]|nr:dihydroneopterin aldolase [Hahella sp. KA22]QAY58035.1 dihydroneopterin aldolase [Hahella sp. KA22]
MLGVMDTVLIEGLQVDAIIGVYEFEKGYQQRLFVDIELGCDISGAAREDNLDLTLNYAAVSERLREYAAASRFQLIETLAERFAELLQKEFGAPWLRLTIRKPGAVAEARSVGVRIERGARKSG